MTPSQGTCPAPDGCNLTILEEIRDNTRTTNVKLFGSSDADHENETGRLPKVESSAKAAHQRIDKLERRLVWASGFAAAVSAIGTAVGTVIVEKFFKP